MTNDAKGSVDFDSVVKNFGAVTALKRLDLSIIRGQLVTLLGPSGCGKTTILRLIAGFESASEGWIVIGGEDVVTHLSATYRKVSMVFESYALFPHMSVQKNVAYGLTVSAIPKAEARDRAEAGLEMVGLAGFGARLPSELSGGQQQRVAVARAIVLELEVLLLDEPLSNLDAKLRRHVREVIRQIQQRLGLTAVYVTHDQEETMAVSDRIIVMKNVEIAQEGTPRVLYECPNSAFIADFIGDANLLDCDVSGTEDGIATVHMGKVEVRARNPMACTWATKLALHPHAARLVPAADGQAAITGVITYAAYLGNQIQYSIDSEAGALFVTSRPTAQAFATGEAVGLVFGQSETCIVPNE